MLVCGLWAPWAYAQGSSLTPEAQDHPLRLTLTSGLLQAPATPSASATAAAPQLATADGNLPSLQLLPLEVTVNGGPAGNWVLLERGGMLHAPDEAFKDWRVIRRATAIPLVYKGQEWFALSAVPGFEAQRNFSEQTLALKFSPQAFSATRVASPPAARPPQSPATLAGFANYDLSYTRSRLNNAAPSADLGALLELGVSGEWGVLTSTYAARNLTSSDPLQTRNVRRLETTSTRDLPDSNLTLRLGDSSTRSGSTGRAVYFGGFQLGRNFGLVPGFISQPLPVVAGLSSAPSTVELFINDALRQTSQVPTGPFAVDNFPLLSGGGQARIVVRDALGRETVVVQDFFSHAELLEQGLSDWSVEAGAVRKELGTSNARYGPLFVSGLWRYGLTKTTTLESRSELARGTQGTAMGWLQVLPFDTLGQLGLAVSHDDQRGRGSQYALGIERTDTRHGASLRTEGATRGYRQLGMDANTLAYKRQLSGTYSYSTDKGSAIGLGYARIASFDSGSLATYSANYSIRLGERSSLSLSAVHVTGMTGPSSGSSTSVGVSMQVPLEKQVSVASSITHRNGTNEGFISANKGLTGDTGFSWRTLAGQRTRQNYAEGGLYYQGNQGSVSADLGASGIQQTIRLGARGSLVAIDSQLFATRQLDGSFALVEVPGYADVGVGFQGNILARTNADGKALVPRLQPFQANSIRLDPSELPISAELDSIEQVVVPGNRQGVLVKFPVRTGRAALLKIVFDDGQPAPAGAEITLKGDKQVFYVARRGEAFVTGLQADNRLELVWNNERCTFSVTLPPGTADDIARVGPLQCSGVSR
jgi:outer membrane usher protein